jgi:hypothetical protein
MVSEVPSKHLVASFPNTNPEAISEKLTTTPMEVVLPVGKGRVTRCSARNPTSACNPTSAHNPTTIKIKKKI